VSGFSASPTDAYLVQAFRLVANCLFDLWHSWIAISGLDQFPGSLNPSYPEHVHGSR